MDKRYKMLALIPLVAATLFGFSNRGFCADDVIVQDGSASAPPQSESEEVNAPQGLLQDFDSLGGNDVLLEKARLLSPDQKVEIVQDRIVDRRLRFELAPEFGSTVGGDSYNNTNNFGLNAHFHINPYVSLGAKYTVHTNQLTNEARNLLNNKTDIVPDLDWPLSQALALVNVYPIYGKMNMFNMGVVHFDLYGIVGGGVIELRRGQSTTYTGGIGLGLWISQHLTSRIELRYQGYEAQWLNGPVQMDTTVASVQFGYLL